MAGPFGAPNAGRIPASAFYKSNGKIAGPAANAFFVSSTLNTKDTQYITVNDALTLTRPMALSETTVFSDSAEARIKTYFDETAEETIQIQETFLQQRNVVATDALGFREGVYFNSSVLLLLHGDGVYNGSSIIDSSLYNRTPTKTGSVFTITSPKKYGSASLHFSDNTSSLSFTSNDFIFGTQNFTIEFWYYTPNGANATVGSTVLVQLGNDNIGSLKLFTSNTNNPASLRLAANTSTSFSDIAYSSTSMPNNQWHHIALTRKGNVFTVWLNGQSFVTGTNTVNLFQNILYFGNNPSLNKAALGFYDDVRVTKQCLYTSAFTPPPLPFGENFNGYLELDSTDATTFTDNFRNITYQNATEIVGVQGAEPETITTTGLTPTYDPYFYSVPILLHAEGSPLSQTISNSGVAFSSITTGTVASLSAEQAKYGLTSIKFPDPTSTQTTSSHVRMYDANAFTFEYDDFTIEFWFYTNSGGHGSLIEKTPSNNILFCYGDTSASNKFELRSALSYNPMRLAIVFANEQYLAPPGAVLANNQWHHAAITRSSRYYMKLWVNGQLYSSGTIPDFREYYAETQMFLGANSSYNLTPQFVGFIDEVRVTKNLARYTGAFTPPTGPFPDLFGYEVSVVEGIAGFDDPYFGNGARASSSDAVLISPNAFVGTHVESIDDITNSDQIIIGYGAAAFDGFDVSLQSNVSHGLRELLDKLTYTETFSSSGIYQGTQSDVIYAAEQILFGIPVSVTQSLTTTDVVTIIQSIRVFERLGVNARGLANAINKLSLSERFQVFDNLYRFIFAIANETFGATDVPVFKFLFSRAVTETVNIDETFTSKFIIRLTANEKVNLDSINVLNYLFKPTLTDVIITSAAYVSPNDTITTWVVNTGNSAVTQYTNYNFNSFAESEKTYLGASETGLYELIGDDDDGTNIIAHLKSGLMQLNSSRFTSFKAAYLGLRGGGDWVLKLQSGDGKEYIYSIVAQDMQTTKVRFGKGLRSRYFAFELLSTGQDFDLDNIEFIPLLAKRHV